MSNLLVLIDASSYLYRAFHALPPLTNSQGEPTGAIFGVLNMVRKLLKEYEPDYVAVVFDAKGPTFRHEMYPAYKATRPPMPDELRAQIKPLHDVIKAMGLPLLCVEGVEADDVIGTLTHQAIDQDVPVIISTGDKDLAQLVNHKVTLINTMTNEILTEKNVETKFGIGPELIVDYLTLIGDKVDNVPGVPNVGPKTALKWLIEYGNLEKIIQNAEKINGKVGENLQQCRSQLPFSKQLLTIKCDVKIPIDFHALRPVPLDQAALTTWLKRLEFKNLLAEFTSQKAENNANHYQTVLDQKTLEHWLAQLAKAKQFSFDTETTSLNTICAEIVGVSFSVSPHEAAYVPLAHDYPDAPKQLNRENVLKQLQPLLNDKSKTIIGHNLKYDINVLKNHGITLNASLMDTLLESYILNSSSSRHDMDTLAAKYLNIKTILFEDIAGKGSKQLTFNHIELDKASPYAAEDADITLQLHHVLFEKLNENKKLLHVLNDIEMPVMPILAEMERTGVLIDAEKLTVQSQNLAKRIAELEEEAYVLAGEMFNLASPKQLQEILYTKSNLPILKKTPTGTPSTAEEVLQELAIDYPLPKVILEYRSLSKLKSTYTDSLPKQIDERTGRVHTSYNQAVTATGRLSSTNPNLQNIPIRNEEGRRIRQAFIAPPGYKILSADYSQIELRIMAHLSKDEKLLHAFAAGLDIHRATASEVFGVKVEEVNATQRRSAKAINFGLMYGMSAFGLSRQLGVPRNLAQEYMDKYFLKYPGIKKYMENTRATAHQQGYVETLYGRRLYLPEINVRNMARQRAAERAAINAPMQGTAADIIKLAMIAVNAWLKASNSSAKMIMQVHDELIFEVPEKETDMFSNDVKRMMESVKMISVPLEVQVGIGNNWDEAH